MACCGQRAEAIGRDRLAAGQAAAIAPGRDPLDRRRHLARLVAQRLLERLARLVVLALDRLLAGLVVERLAQLGFDPVDPRAQIREPRRECLGKVGRLAARRAAMRPPTSSSSASRSFFSVSSRSSAAASIPASIRWMVLASS